MATVFGERYTLLNIGSSIQTGTQGLDMSTAPSSSVWSVKVTVTAAAAFTVKVALTGRDADAHWGSLGMLNEGTALAGTTTGYWYFIAENLKAVRYLSALTSEATGSPTVAISISPGY